MTKDDLNRICSLPDGLSREEIEDEFNFVLRSIQPSSNFIDRDLVMSALFELSRRQWGTYSLLSSDVTRKIENLILTVWIPDSLDSTEKLLGIISRLGLAKTFSALVSTNFSVLKPEIRNEIESAIIEFGDGVDDPYSGVVGLQHS